MSKTVADASRIPLSLAERAEMDQFDADGNDRLVSRIAAMPAQEFLHLGRTLVTYEPLMLATLTDEQISLAMILALRSLMEVYDRVEERETGEET